MKLCIALDSFKSSIGTYEAGAAVAASLAAAYPAAEIVVMGMADGGEGSLEVFCREGGAERVAYAVTGPLKDLRVSAGHGWRESDRTAFVEMAMASGLALVDPGNLDALAATTLGTGECLVRAAASRPDRLLLAVGGSATTDGGTGAARAAGWRFLNADGNEIGWGGGGLIDLARIDPPPNRFFPPVEVLCDVDNPLLGPEGSAVVYGPQKGADPHQVQHLEKGLTRLHDVVLDQLGLDMNISGGGAAGGLAAGALAFFGGILKPGVDTLMGLTGLDTKLDGADWLITGEGSFDHQSLRGKVISGLLETCRSKNIRVGVLAGQVRLSPEQLQAAGVDWALPVMKGGMSLDYAMTHTAELLRERAGEAAAFLTRRGEPRASRPGHS